MDEELKIVIPAELDEAASAEQIKKQLPRIADTVSKGGPIKLVAEIDTGSLRGEAQKVSKQFRQAVNTQKIGVELNLDERSIAKINSAMKNLGVSPDISRAMTEKLDQMGIQIDKISGRWETVNRTVDGIATHEERLLNLTIQGTDQVGRTVSYLGTYNTETQQIETHLTNVTANLEKQRRKQERLAAQEAKDNENRIVALQKQTDLLEKYHANYLGEGKGEKVTNADNLVDLEKRYQHIREEILALQNTAGSYSKVRKQEIDSEIAELNRLVITYQKAQYSATDLRSKDVTSSISFEKSNLDKIETTLRKDIMLTDEFKGKLETLRAELDLVGDSNGLSAYLDHLREFEGEIKAFSAAEELRQTFAEMNSDMSLMPSKIQALQGQLRQLASPSDVLRQNMSEVVKLSEEWKAASSDDERLRIWKELTSKVSECKQEMTDLNKVQNAGVRDERLTSGIEKLRADIETVGRTWSAFKTDVNLNREFNNIRTAAQKNLTMPELQKLTAQFNVFKSEVKAAGLNIMSFFDTLKNNFGKVMEWVGATSLLFRSIRLMKTAVSTVTELDTALVDLRKTTTMSSSDLAEFYREANEEAKKLGVTTKENIQSAADWSRLGYGDKESATRMASLAAQFAAISPGMTIDESTTGLVSVIKAYDMQVEDVLDGIMSKINAVGNTAATNNSEIITGLQDAASALAATGDTLDQTIALFTAGQETIQNASKVGNALKTISLRIRGYSEETKELDENLKNISGEVADLTKVASNNGRGISLFRDDDPTKYKSVGEYLHDISDIYDELDDKTKNSLLEKLFGKRQANIGAAILTNIKAYDKALDTMANSAGSADREMSVIADSIEYRWNKLKETWVGVAQDLFQTDDIKAVITLFQGLSDAVSFLTDKLGLLGTVGIASAIGFFVKLKSSVGEPKTTGSTIIWIVPTYILVATRNESVSRI